MKHSIFESSYLIIYRYYINICHGINKDKFKIPIYSAVWAHLFTLQFILKGNIDFSYVQLILHEHKNSSFCHICMNKKLIKAV